MSIHYCIGTPCSICASNTASGTRLQVSAMTTTHSLPFFESFFTWNEAVAYANSVAHPSERKPKVGWFEGKWRVAYRARPILINGGAA